MNYNDVPTCFFFEDKPSICSEFFVLLNSMKENIKKNDFDQYVSNLLLIMYNFLDVLVRQGIYPDSIFELIVFDFKFLIFNCQEKRVFKRF